MGAKVSNQSAVVVHVLGDNSTDNNRHTIGGGGGNKQKNKSCLIDMKILTLMLPVWYNHEPLDATHISLAKSVWSLILNDKSEEYLRNKRDTPGFTYSSAVVWFFDTFYNRLFEMYPR